MKMKKDLSKVERIRALEDNYASDFFANYEDACDAAIARQRKLSGGPSYENQFSLEEMDSLAFKWAMDDRYAANERERRLLEEEVAEEMKGFTQDEFEREVLRRKGLNSDEVDQEMEWQYHRKSIGYIKLGFSDDETDQEIERERSRKI